MVSKVGGERLSVGCFDAGGGRLLLGTGEVGRGTDVLWVVDRGDLSRCGGWWESRARYVERLIDTCSLGCHTLISLWYCLEGLEQETASSIVQRPVGCSSSIRGSCPVLLPPSTLSCLNSQSM